jgi:hypothetical protein
VTTPAANGLVATTETSVDGIAAFPAQHVDDPALKGKVADLTSEADGDHERWTLAVEDNSNLRHTYSIELPAKVVFSIATGTNVLVEPEVTDAAGRIAVSDDHGALLLAIAKLPAGWSAEAQTQVAVRIHEPGGAGVELVPAPWRSFELAGAKFVGAANAAKRDHYPDGWVDFAIVRAP